MQEDKTKGLRPVLSTNQIDTIVITRFSKLIAAGTVDDVEEAPPGEEKRMEEK